MRRLSFAGRAFILLVVLNGAGDLLMGTNHVVYLQAALGTGFQASVVIGLTLAAVALFDLPTGIIADGWGRKRTMVAGFFALATGEALYGLGGSPALVAWGLAWPSFLLSGVLRGAGMALLSGVFISWYFGALGEQAGGREAGSALSLAEGFRHLSGVLAGLGASLLISVWSGLPMLAAAALHAATGLWAWACLPENRGDPAPQPVQALVAHLGLFRRRPGLLRLAAADLLVEAGFVFLVFLWQPLLLSLGGQEELLGIVFPFLMLALAAGSFSAGWLAARWSRRRVAAAGALVMAAALALLATAGGVLPGLVLLALAEFGLGLVGPPLSHLINGLLSEGGRATLNSAISAAGGVAGLVASLAAGLLLDRLGPGAAYLFAALPVLLAAPLVWRVGGDEA